MRWVREINIENRTYYFFDDIIHIKNVDPNNIKIGQNHKKIFLSTTLGM